MGNNQTRKNKKNSMLAPTTSTCSSSFNNSKTREGSINQLPCIDRKLFISFRDETFYHVELPDDDHHDQIHLITSAGSQLFCATELGKIIRYEHVDSKVSTQLVPTSSEFTNDKTKIKFLLAGYYHVIVIKESNKIYVNVLSENNQYGKLQVNNSEPFSLIDSRSFIQEDHVITHACCGTYCTIIVLNHRYIYMAGRLEEQEDSYVPLLIVQDESVDIYPMIKNISAGYGHVIVETIDGQVYGMGMNNYGQTISVTSSQKLEKINLNNLVNITAIRLSHLTCYTTNDTFTIHGYTGSNLETYDKVTDYHFRKQIDFSRDLCIFGGFTSIVTFNERTRELMACGSTQNAPQRPYDILTRLKKQFADTNKLELISYIDFNHTVIDVACGSSIIGVLMGAVRKDTLMINNLLKMKKYATHEMEHSSQTIPFHDIVLFQ